MLPVADQQVPEDARLVQVPQADHVLHPVDGGGVHGLDVAGILRGNPVLLEEDEDRERYVTGRKERSTPGRGTRWENIHGRVCRPQLLSPGHDRGLFERFRAEEGNHFLVYWSSKRHMTLGILAGTQSRAARASSASGEFLTNTSLFIPSRYYISISLVSPLPQNTAKQRKDGLEN